MASTLQDRLRVEMTIRNATVTPIRIEAADRIDALEKALDAAETLANEVQDLPDGPYHAMYVALCQYRVARDALPPIRPTRQG